MKHSDGYIRNLEIYRKHVEEKITYRKLAEEYGITATRIQQICRKVETRRYNETDETKIRNYLEINYRKDYSSTSLTRMVNAVMRYAFYHCDLCKKEDPDLLYNPSVEDFIAVIEAIPEEEWAEIRNAGAKTAELMKRIKTDYKGSTGNTLKECEGGKAR